jgi:hypothetical protein
MLPPYHDLIEVIVFIAWGFACLSIGLYIGRATR